MTIITLSSIWRGVSRWSRFGRISLLYSGLSALFCLPLFEHPYGLGIADWDRHLFYYGSVLRNAAFGQLPFWNPWDCGGNVLWQNPQVSLISPAYLLSLVMPLALAMKVNIFLHYCAAFAGMHLLLRRTIGLRSLPAIAYLGSLFVFSGSLALHLNAGHSNVLPAFLLPLLFHCFLSAVSGSIRYVLAGAAVLAACFLSGGLHIAPLAAVLFAPVAVIGVFAGRTWKPAIVAVLIFAGGMAYAAPKLVPAPLFVTGSDLVDTRDVQPPDRMTLEHSNDIGWFGAGLTLISATWLLAFHRRREQWLALSAVLGLALVSVLAPGEFSSLGPASLLGRWPVGLAFRVPYIVVFPLLAATAIGCALQLLQIERAPLGVRRFVDIFCLVALCQLGLANSAQLRGVFSLPSLGIEGRVHERQTRLRIATEPTPGREFDSPAFRSLLEGVSVLNCDEPLQLPRTAEPGEALVSADGPLTLFDSAFSPNRISSRVLTGRQPARLVLNQNFSPGWSSNVGPVIRGPDGRPAVLLPAGFAGRVSFTFMPPGLWLGLSIFAIALAASVVVWRYPQAAESTAARVQSMVAARVVPVAERIDFLQLAFLASAVVGFLWIYEHYPYRPTVPDNGWWNFWDQSQYLRSARAFAQGNWAGSEHWYPVGYPILAAPFVRLIPRDPFLPLNLTLFVIFGWLCFRLFRPVLGGWLTFVALFAALALPTHIVTPQGFAFPLWAQFAIPWNTNAVAPAYLAALLGVRSNWQTGRRAIDVGLGLLLGIVVSIRPTDALPLGLVLAVYCGSIALWQRRWLPFVLIALGALVCVVPSLLFMEHAHGGLQSPYLMASRDIGFSFSNLPERAYQVLLRSEDTYSEEHSALYQLQPWLHLAVPLAVAWACIEPRLGALPVGLALSSWILYLAYNDLSPFNFIRFFLVHYIVWTLPVLTCAGVAGALRIICGRRWRIALLVLLLAGATASLRLTPSPVAGAQVTSATSGCCNVRYGVAFPSARTIDAIDVDGVTQGNPIAMSTQELGLVADEERLKVVSGYQVLRRPGGIRIIFKRHIAASRLGFTIDDSFERLAAVPAAVTPIRFRATFGGAADLDNMRQ